MDVNDQYPDLPVTDWLSTKRDADMQYRVMEFLTQRPTGEQWANTAEIYDALRATDPRPFIGRLYTNLDRLTAAQFLEKKQGEPEPERGGRTRPYYRATSDGTRAYNNSKKAASRPGLTLPNQKPAPAVA